MQVAKAAKNELSGAAFESDEMLQEAEAAKGKIELSGAAAESDEVLQEAEDTNPTRKRRPRITGRGDLPPPYRPPVFVAPTTTTTTTTASRVQARKVAYLAARVPGSRTTYYGPFGRPTDSTDVDGLSVAARLTSLQSTLEGAFPLMDFTADVFEGDFRKNVLQAKADLAHTGEEVDWASPKLTGMRAIEWANTRKMIAEECKLDSKRGEIYISLAKEGGKAIYIGPLGSNGDRAADGKLVMSKVRGLVRQYQPTYKVYKIAITIDVAFDVTRQAAADHAELKAPALEADGSIDWHYTGEMVNNECDALKR